MMFYSRKWIVWDLKSKQYTQFMKMLNKILKRKYYSLESLLIDSRIREKLSLHLKN